MKNYKRIKGSKLQQTLIDIIDQHEEFKNTYFWRPPGSASARRSYEKKYSRPKLTFCYEGKKYEIRQKVECSCKNIYYNFAVYVDDTKKDIRVIKKLVS